MITVKEIKTRKKYIIFSIAYTLILFFVLSLVSSRYMFAYTRKNHTCLPYSFWVIDKSHKQRFKYDDFISFIGRGIMNFQDGVKWVKLVGGLPGDKVEVIPISGQQRTVMVNYMPKVLNIKARVIVYRKEREPLELEVYERDTRDRLMPVISPQIIPEGKFFVYTKHERSFDSRYWGLVDDSQVIGTAAYLF